MNYCPVCKREFREQRGGETRHCPICGTRLIRLSEADISEVRRNVTEGKN